MVEKEDVKKSISEYIRIRLISLSRNTIMAALYYSSLFKNESSERYVCACGQIVMMVVYTEPIGGTERREIC